jgi:Fur family ferric uptake transcriptional regulator
LEALQASGLKRTKPRETLLRYLAENHGPFSAKDLHEALGRRGLDAVTTYRCLAAFEKARLVARCDFGDGIARYEFSDGPEHHHHHVVCVGCRKVEKIDDCQLLRLEDKVRGLGYSEVRHVLEFTGLCRSCS